MMILFKPQI